MCISGMSLEFLGPRNKVQVYCRQRDLLQDEVPACPRATTGSISEPLGWCHPRSDRAEGSHRSLSVPSAGLLGNKKLFLWNRKPDLFPWGSEFYLHRVCRLQLASGCCGCAQTPAGFVRPFSGGIRIARSVKMRFLRACEPWQKAVCPIG